MPKDYAKRFAQLIASDPNLEAEYAIQLYDLAFTYRVAEELEKLGFHPSVDGRGVLTVHQRSATDEKSQQGRLDAKGSPPTEKDIYPWTARPSLIAFAALAAM